MVKITQMLRFQALSAPYIKFLFRQTAVLSLACLFTLLASAAIWTDRLGDFERSSAAPITLDNPRLIDEYGFEQGEVAEYRFGNRRFDARAYQTVDATTGTALYQYLQPLGAKPSEYEKLAVEEKLDLYASETATTLVVHYQNYVMRFDGDRPTWDVLKAFLGYAPKLTVSTRPTLPSYLPRDHQISGSARYILGPESLGAFAPEIPAGIAAFSMGAEGQIAEYQDGASKLKLLIFSYPTPQIARKKLEEFQALPNVLAKRESSLIVLCTNVTDNDHAERVLSKVRFRGEVTINQETKSEAAKVHDLLINIVIMVGVLVALGLLAGLTFGGLRILRRGKEKEDGDSIVRLHID